MKNIEKDYEVGFTCGAFDFLHAGHVLFLEEAKNNCDYLIVGLHIDPSVERPLSKNKPIQTAFERYEQLRACKYVDEIIPYETEEELVSILKSRRIDIRFLGSDYCDKDFTGEGLLPVCYIDREHSFSSSNIRKKIIEEYNSKDENSNIG